MTKEEIKAVALIAKEIKPDFIKTSTGFGSGGATIDDVKLMVDTVDGLCQIKAAGDIRDWTTCRAMIEAGATRFAVISVGTNNSYSHPAQTTLDKLISAGVKVYRTDLNGTVIITSDGITVKVK